MWQVIISHPWLALFWALVCFGAGFIVRDFMSEFFVSDSARHDFLRLRSCAAYYLRVTRADYLPTSKQAEAGRALEDACSITL